MTNRECLNDLNETYQYSAATVGYINNKDVMDGLS